MPARIVNDANARFDLKGLLYQPNSDTALHELRMIYRRSGIAHRHFLLPVKLATEELEGRDGCARSKG